MTNADSPRSLNNSRWVLRSTPEQIVSTAGTDSLDAQQLITVIAESNDIPHCYPNLVAELASRQPNVTKTMARSQPKLAKPSSITL